jgi:hypothetical protein
MSEQDLPSEVQPHDMKTCALCQFPAYAVDGTPNMPAIHHTVETLVANGLLRKLRKSNGEIAYIERNKQ